jgi:membrane protease YdiL (CAAX protease family)
MMKTFKQHPVWLFFGLAYVLTWIVWGTEVAQAQGLIAFHLPQGLGYWGLATAAYLAAIITGGWPAVKDLLSRLVRWRVGVPLYLIALLLTGAIGLVTLGVYALLGGTVQIGQDVSFTQLLPIFLANFPLMLFTEETAWRGFALPRLQTKYSALWASVIIGLGWGLWHLPLFFIPGAFQTRFPFEGGLASFLAFVLLIIPVSVLLTWLFNHTRGSVLIAAIFHTAFNTTVVYLGVLTHAATLFWLFTGVTWLVAAGVIWVEKPGRLARGQVAREITFVTTS